MGNRVNSNTINIINPFGMGDAIYNKGASPSSMASLPSTPPSSSLSRVATPSKITSLKRAAWGLVRKAGTKAHPIANSLVSGAKRVGYLGGSILWALGYIGLYMIPHLLIKGVLKGALIKKPKKLFQKYVCDIKRILHPVQLAFKAKHLGKAHYNEIPLKGKLGEGRLFLGAHPNVNDSAFNKIMQNRNIKVITLQEPWEEKRFGLNVLFKGSNHSSYNCKDHKLLSQKTLFSVTKEIQEAIRNREDVYVHCHAGQGRSAQAVIAFLIYHLDISVDEAIERTRQARPGVTVKTSQETKALKEDSKKRIKSEERIGNLQLFSDVYAYSPELASANLRQIFRNSC